MNEPSEDIILPVLRHDLQLLEGPVALDGSPGWIILDPLRNKYFYIGWAAFQLLSRWSVGKASILIAKIKQETTLDVHDDDIQSLLSFLFANSLTLNSANDTSNDYLEQYLASKPGFLKWLIHNYLFVKIPLVKPTAFLRKTLVYFEPFFSITSAALFAFLGLIGLYMVGRQWGEFTSTFLYFFNVQGLAFYFVSLTAIKILHELAHAYTVIRYGCQVPTMGVALLVMFPILYTDTSDTWKVKSAMERAHVGAAGMIMELYIACIATFSWAFLPDGIFKSAAFIMATTSWMLSLAINTNILMRFDGYYIFSDLLGIQNLQKRSFDIGKWKLTEVLFNLRLRPPEALSLSMLRKLYIYAWCVWVYRFFLFIGIAVLVYYMFFKILGIILFAIEILWFIVLPVTKLIGGWWEMRSKIIKTSRFYLTATIFTCLIILFIYPWNSTIKVPAVYKSEQKSTLFSPTPGYIDSSFLIEGQSVEKNEILLTLNSPNIDHKIATTLQEVDILKLQAKRIAASSEELSNIQIIIQQLQEARSKLNGLNEKKNEMTIRAPISGVIYDMQKSLHHGRWINETLPIATIIVSDKPTIEGVISEEDLPRVHLQSSAKFIPENPQINSIWTFVQEIEQANLQALDIPVLASVFGGKVPVQYDDSNQLVPDKSVYRVRFNISAVENVSVEQVIRGVVHIEGEKQSFINRAYKIVASVLLRESGF
jgi:putative peptide zinc metalloprotease protein